MAKFVTLVCVVVMVTIMEDVTAQITAGIFSDELSASSHNQYRQKHPGTPDVQGSRDLALKARDCAFKIFQSNLLGSVAQHPCNPVEGENIYLGYTTNPAYLPAATLPWYNEVKTIDFTADSWYMNVFYSKAGHFTQLVWKSTYAVGCGWAISTTVGRTLIICRYLVRGNTPPGSLAVKNNVMPPVDKGCIDTNTIGLCDLMAKQPAMCTHPTYAKLAKSSCAKTCNYC